MVNLFELNYLPKKVEPPACDGGLSSKGEENGVGKGEHSSF